MSCKECSSIGFSTYLVRVVCMNCGAAYSISLPKGKKVKSQKCQSCGVKGDLTSGFSPLMDVCYRNGCTPGKMKVEE